MENDKPQGYYDEIEITASKKEDLLQFLKGYEVSVYSNSDEGYDYLEDNDLMLVVKNPYCDETIDIELAGEFTLYFAGWHTHYSPYRTIFTLCDNVEREFYHKKGYRVGKEYDQDVLTDLMGAEVIHDITMEKIIG